MNILSRRIETRQEEEQQELDDTNTLKKKEGNLRHRDFIEEKVCEYLYTTPCANVHFEQMPELVWRLKGGRMEKNEEADAGENGHSADADITVKKDDDDDDDVTMKKEEEEDNNITTNDDNNDESAGFDLTDAETLQLLNHMPTEPVEIHLMIEELTSRMDDDRQNEMLQLISEYAGVAEEATEEEEEELVGEEEVVEDIE
eukprot:CAMPEP_0197233366 /NCGR_PEP_ID=MMETSP1429-20130617/1436_1 /TAXON_ID=49237 /ORGANISM="Chaetoceros  sp., Strain UNC1202" /LENGTH=200 /DNA_ID=CAMNT_0042691593 /DNA_START=205 /DNA_END=807 /DNA_ORIENTATION=-